MTHAIIAEDWMVAASCRDHPYPDLWYADLSAGRRGRERTHERGAAYRATTICAGCPVRRECLLFALRHDEKLGIWGGLNTAQRERLKGRRG